MRVFLTGATGFIGSHIMPELIAAGPSGARPDAIGRGREALVAAGAELYRGALEDLGEPARAARPRRTAVIHTAFDHDFSNFAANARRISGRSRRWARRLPAPTGRWSSPPARAWAAPGRAGWRPRT